MNPPHLGVVAGYDKDGYLRAAPQIHHILDVTIDQSPSHAGLNRSLRYLRQTSAPNRLHNDPIRPLRVICLYGLQDLRALRDGVAVGVHNLHVDSRIPRCRLCRSCLLGLEIVFFGNQRNEKSQLFHVAAPPKLRPTVHFCLPT